MWKTKGEKPWKDCGKERTADLSAKGEGETVENRKKPLSQKEIFSKGLPFPNIFDKIVDHIPKAAVASHIVLYLADGVVNGGMIPAGKFVPDRRQ